MWITCCTTEEEWFCSSICDFFSYELSSLCLQLLWTWQGVLKYHEEIADYYNARGVSVVLLLRRNLLKRLVSIMANSYDKEHKLLNGTHKSHVHKPEDVIF
jgi:hypothetical protein